MVLCRALAVALALVASAVAAAAGPTTCARELAVIETTLLKAAIRMQAVANISQDQKCATYRTNAEVVTKAREVFDRCSTGPDREQDIGQMDGVLSEVRSALATTCAMQ
jgi:hypothetical protein